MPPVASDYVPVGKTEEVAGVPCYVTGDAKATKAIVGIYDIFGHHPSTQQGADLLAALTGFRIYIPDLFEDGGLPHHIIPPDTPEKMETFMNYLSGIAKPDKHIKSLTDIANYLKQHGVEKVGLYGLCWGSKPGVLACGKDTPYSAAVLIHPSLIVPEDAKSLSVPIALFTTIEEDNDAMKTFQSNVQANPVTSSTFVSKHYGDINHGFAGARANFEDPKHVERFKEVYENTAKFFLQHLQ